MNLYLTWASGIRKDNWSEYHAYFASVSSVLREDRFVCLTDDIDPEYERQISALSCDVVRTARKNKRFFTSRWHAYWEFLLSEKFKAVVITDSRDVVFQRAPWGFLTDRVRLASEGFAHGRSAFNMTDQMRLQVSQGEELENFAGWEVVNGGICMGCREQAADFCFLMWSNCLGRPSCTDQAVINMVARNLRGTGALVVSDPAADSFCLTGEAVKEGLLSFEPKSRGGKVCDASGEPYAIFHQWDRTIFRNEILNSFLK